MRTLRLGLAQINTTVGDLEGNAAKVLEYVERARAQGVDLVSFPELTITGYPPEDLLLRPQFIEDNVAALKRMAEGCRGITAVVGFVDSNEDIYNAAADHPRRPTGGRLPQALLAQLRRLRREPLLPERQPLPGLRDGRRRRGRERLRGHLVPRRPDAGPGPGRRSGDRQHQRLALPRGQAPLPRADAGHPRLGLRASSSATRTRSADRTSWSSTAPAWCSVPRANCWQGGGLRGGAAWCTT